MPSWREQEDQQERAYLIIEDIGTSQGPATRKDGSMAKEEVAEPQQVQDAPQGFTASGNSWSRVFNAKLQKVREERDNLDAENSGLQASLLDAQDVIAGQALEIRILRKRAGLKLTGQVDYTQKEIKEAQEFDPDKPAKAPRAKKAVAAASDPVTPIKGRHKR